MAPRSLALLIALSLITSSGCATIRREETLAREEMLVQAGFEKKPARTTEQRSELQRLPARMLVRVPFGSEVRYVYADAETCQCLYVGTQSAYETFLHALTREFINNDYRDTSTPHPVLPAEETTRYENRAQQSALDPTTDASVDWDVWE